MIIWRLPFTYKGLCSLQKSERKETIVLDVLGFLCSEMLD
uniref:Uncharacterized protein n=1 Tax=Arundo donax TaxID=35708 RepID=A0A0A9C8I2_ARUDO